MKISNGINLKYFTGTINFPKNSCVKDIRDRDVTEFSTLQKEKIEVLLKYRDASNVIYRLNNALNEESKLTKKEIVELRRNLALMEEYKNILFSKLHTINLKLIEEEEKNY